MIEKLKKIDTRLKDKDYILICPCDADSVYAYDVKKEEELVTSMEIFFNLNRDLYVGDDLEDTSLKECFDILKGNELTLEKFLEWQNKEGVITEVESLNEEDISKGSDYSVDRYEDSEPKYTAYKDTKTTSTDSIVVSMNLGIKMLSDKLDVVLSQTKPVLTSSTISTLKKEPLLNADKLLEDYELYSADSIKKGLRGAIDGIIEAGFSQEEISVLSRFMDIVYTSMKS